MNIFAVSPNPVVCAEALDDRRLVKMVLETAQMLCTELRRLGETAPALYKATHQNHPCVLWLQTPAHFSWTIELFFALSAEYQRRFEREHKCFTTFRDLFQHWYDSAPCPESWPNCTTFKDAPVHNAYVRYLCWKWNNDVQPPRWTNRSPPLWWSAQLEEAV